VVQETNIIYHRYDSNPLVKLARIFLAVVGVHHLGIVVVVPSPFPPPQCHPRITNEDKYNPQSVDDIVTIPSFHIWKAKLDFFLLGKQALPICSTRSRNCKARASNRFSAFSPFRLVENKVPKIQNSSNSK
jgi:hypothetical protein